MATVLASLVIDGPPRTKKNSQQLARIRGRFFPVQSAAYRKWAKPATLQLQSQWAGRAPLAVPMFMTALVYRDRNTGDCLNFWAAVCDVLEDAGVIENDKLIMHVDGSRLLIDRYHPRVELTLTSLDADAIS